MNPVGKRTSSFDLIARMLMWEAGIFDLRLSVRVSLCQELNRSQHAPRRTGIKSVDEHYEDQEDETPCQVEAQAYSAPVSFPTCGVPCGARVM